MKTIEPNMKLDRQVRKANAMVLRELDALVLLASKTNGYRGDMETIINMARKSCYTINLVNEMVQSACNGQPRPWSEFSPMIDEEFS